MAGATLASTPLTRYRLLQLRSDQKVADEEREYQAKLAAYEAEQERRLLDRAKRDQAIDDAEIDPETREDLKDQIKSRREELDRRSQVASEASPKIDPLKRIEMLQEMARTRREMGDLMEASQLQEQAEMLLRDL